MMRLRRCHWPFYLLPREREKKTARDAPGDACAHLFSLAKSRNECRSNVCAFLILHFIASIREENIRIFNVKFNFNVQRV